MRELDANQHMLKQGQKQVSTSRKPCRSGRLYGGSSESVSKSLISRRLGLGLADDQSKVGPEIRLMPSISLPMLVATGGIAEGG